MSGARGPTGAAHAPTPRHDTELTFSSGDMARANPADGSPRLSSDSTICGKKILYEILVVPAISYAQTYRIIYASY